MQAVDGQAVDGQAVSLEDVLTELGDRGQLVHVERLPARAAETAELRPPLRPELAERLPPGGLWSHQVEAISHARAGRSLAVATGTASGKSLCFQVPIAEAVIESAHREEPPATALLLYPTKALAQDQLRAFTEIGFPGVVPATYDGDTPPEHRRWVRANANVVLTNPDMLHVGLLPHHERWATFLMRLRYVVLDELHTLRGIFGSHVAHLVRRLRRVCARYGSSPTFLFSSATIGSPGTLASALCGLDVAEVLHDGSPRGERLFALWNPPLLDETLGIRGSANVETAALVASLVSAGYRTIAFCRSRKVTELVAADVKRRVGPREAGSVRPYRGGYLPTERRAIEAELFGGKLKGVVATTALELGVDVGGLDACVLDGFPGTIASMWQQAGRAGRTQRRSLAVLVAGADQLDQWLMANPHELLSRAPEPAVVNPSNPFVLEPHLGCAAYESPLTTDDEAWWGTELEEAVRRLVLDDRLRVRDGRAVWAGRGSPAWNVGLRSGGVGEFRIADERGELIGTVDEARAFELVHPGAVYLHQGQAYRVVDLDLHDRAATVETTSGDEQTQARSETSIRVLDCDAKKEVGRAALHVGPVEVTEHVTGYQRKDWRTGQVLGAERLDLPPTHLVTRAFWYVIPLPVLIDAGITRESAPGTLHAAEHAGIGMLPLFTICDRWDVGGVSTPLQADTGAPTIFIYDGYPGGAGIAELGFNAGRRHLEATRDVIAACPCERGCPSCVQSPKCGNLNEPLDKAGAVALLEVLLRRNQPSGDAARRSR